MGVMPDLAGLPTLAEQLALGLDVTVHCRACMRACTLDLAGLVAAGRGGRVALGLPFRCSCCRSRRFSVTVSAERRAAELRGREELVPKPAAS